MNDEPKADEKIEERISVPGVAELPVQTDASPAGAEPPAEADDTLTALVQQATAADDTLTALVQQATAADDTLTALVQQATAADDTLTALVQQATAKGIVPAATGPLSANTVQAAAAHELAASAPALDPADPPLALVVEDDFDASLIFAKALQAAGLKVEVLRAGDAAVKRLTEIVPNLVVLDLHLPEVDGTEILARIRADWRLGKTRVIVVTADARMAEPVKDDADLVLLKPASYSQVRDFALRLVRRA